MPRPILEARIHPAIRQTIAGWNAEILREVQEVVAADAVVVVGMRQNPFPKKACKELDAIGAPYRYLEYGSYLSDWRWRTALKMWPAGRHLRWCSSRGR